MPSVAERLTQHGTFRALLARIRATGERVGDDASGVVAADGLWGAFAPILAGTAARRLNRPLLYVTAHLDQADEVRDELELFCGADAALLSAFETLAGQGAASDEIHAERIRLCAHLQDVTSPADPGRSTDAPPIIVAPIQALMQPVPAPEALRAALLTLTVGQHEDPRALADWLARHGYTRLDQVESPGDFALRGDILDVYPPAEPDPYRIDFYGDTIESIRAFEIGTQRSDRELSVLRVAGVPGLQYPDNDKNPSRSDLQPPEDAITTTSFLSYLPADALIALADAGTIQEMGHTFWRRLSDRGDLETVERVFQRTGEFTQLHLHSLPGEAEEDGGAGDSVFRFGVQSLARFETSTAEALKELSRLSLEREVVVFCDNEAEQHRFRALWADTVGPWPATLHLAVGLMHHGFDWPDGRMTVIGHHEVFHRYQQRRRLRRIHAARPIESWLDLNVGDHVVHVVHGIARFLGLHVMRKGESKKAAEFLTLEFAERARMHVPVTQIDLVQKYVGAGTAAPSLSKLGGTRWARTKQRVEEAVTDLAADLLRIQAARRSRPGITYPPDTPWQREFEESFIYTETEDQLRAAAEIKRDMEKPVPMDRLLCGDVGYGKTELAMRAAFKAVEGGRQVAVLVPTTVLAEQHERTFRERFADYPCLIESLSRFKTPRAQKQIIQAARAGQVDVLIGTHRLLSRDVGFKNLGLLIIDEEQRFGVEHKEKLKRFRTTVDVLTMSATPIPRTLHMALLGIRDIAALETPPLDRRSIVTRVTRFNDELVRDSILAELNREGQVFFVHNFVRDIESFAERVRRIVPEARVAVAHGQMPERALEKVMLAFFRREIDVLVCTTIIESGLDIPNCNTILIDQADRFGLSELHQLRGRVGRYKHRACCYLFVSRNKTLSSTAARRLKAIEEFSDLGAGFRIALRDLEIRGAGNILGPEQSGHIAAVGYEMYCQLLDAAVRRQKHEPVEVVEPVHLELEVPAHVPESYVASDRQRMEIYRRLARCRTRADLEQLETDIRDAFGPYPESVRTLLDLAELRILAAPYRIKSITQREPDLVFVVREMVRVEPLLARGPGSPRMADATTIHWRLDKAYFEPATLIAVLRKLLQAEQGVSTMSSR